MNSFKYYNYLGFHNPYYTLVDNHIVLHKTFNDAVDSLEGEKILDISSVLEVLCTGYILGDKTIVQNIFKTPWMAKPNDSMTGWNYFEVPSHCEKTISTTEISEKLFRLLKAEVADYIKGFDNIGILLTGGMDSRVVACVLNDLMSCEENRNKKVIAMTWGKENSRDVEYAKRIAKLFNWEWRHILVDEKQMNENIKICVNNGCEYSPLHLHGMSQVSKESNTDCILAGSFGDSIGRGEYSGENVRNIKPLVNNLRNFGGWISKELVPKEIVKSQKEIVRYHLQFPQKENYQQIEQDYQLHYLRRMLNPCMSIINEEKPLFQVFTSPTVFGFMWSLDPILRNDKVYETLLKDKFEQLLDIPWARTGVRFPGTAGKPDNFTKQHHNYGQMIREEFFNQIESEIFNLGQIHQNTFDIRAIGKIFDLCKTQPIKNSYYYEEKLLWLSCLSKMMQKFGIETTKEGKINRDHIARLSSVIKYKIKSHIK